MQYKHNDEKNFTDIHHHLLWGLDDDGPQSSEDMQGMIRQAIADGIATLIATPHVAPGLRRFDEKVFNQRLAEARHYCAEHRLPLTILPGAEILFTEYTCEMLRSGKVPTLAGTEYVLVEFSSRISFEGLGKSLRQVAQAGFIPVLAHCERYDCLVRHLSRTGELKAKFPLRFQVNAGSFIQSGGYYFRRFLKQVMALDLIDFIASDAHGTQWRQTNLTECFKYVSGVYDQETSRKLLSGNAADFFLKQNVPFGLESVYQKKRAETL